MSNDLPYLEKDAVGHWRDVIIVVEQKIQNSLNQWDGEDWKFERINNLHCKVFCTLLRIRFQIEP